MPVIAGKPTMLQEVKENIQQTVLLEVKGSSTSFAI